MHVDHQRRAQGEQLVCQLAELLRHLGRGHAVTDQRLVYVEDEQPRLGVGDLAQRLAVDVEHLEEGDHRKAGHEHGRHVAQRLEVVLVESLPPPGREAHAAPETLDQCGLEPGLARGLVEAVVRLPRGKQLFDEPERQPAVLARLLDLLQGVAVLA